MGTNRSPDWIEVYNAGNAPIDLAGYRLTNDANDKSKWSFPSVILGSAESVVIFASGQSSNDYVDKSGNLHTNFTLQRTGDYLALVSPDNTVLSEFGDTESTFPEQLVNVSYGIAQSIALVHQESESQFLVPINAESESVWFEPDFDASARGFANGIPSFGLEMEPDDRTNFAGQFQIELPRGTQAVYTRTDFHLESAAALNSLNLKPEIRQWIRGVSKREESGRRECPRTTALVFFRS